MIIQWTNDLAIGVGIIDDQHKKLVERINSFTSALETGDIHKCQDAVNYFISYAIQHFGAEELIMIRNGYDEFHIHRDEHSWFIKYVADIKRSFLNHQITLEQLHEMQDFLVKWTINHIQIKDKRISEHIG